VIPEDWEEDLLAPPSDGGASDDSDPFARPSGHDTGQGMGTDAGSGFIPDDYGTSDTMEPAGPAPAESEQTVPPAPTEPATSAPRAKPAAEPARQTAEEAATQAFLEALGTDNISIPAEDLPEIMERLGNVMRIMIEGMREILMTRTSIKSEFRIEQTMISAGGNNPLKFSISPEQAVEAMVRPSVRGYLDAPDAAAQALNDIKAHEVAMITGMEAALRGILKRLDPKVLEEKIATGGGFSSVLKSRKARYWEIYESMYAEISDQAENDFHELFAREFARAYTEQLDKLK